MSSEIDQNPDLTIIMVSYNTAHLLERLFAAIFAAQGPLKLQIIVVDNASRDNSRDVLRVKYSNVELIENLTNVGFARANNQAVARARGRYILLLNTDAFVSPDTFLKTIEYMDTHRRCGVLGVKAVAQNGHLWPSCRYFPTPWNVFLNATGLNKFFRNTRMVDDMSWDHASLRECDWVTGCYYLVRREVIDQVGLFDPRYFLYYEEIDHCRTVHQAGWSVMYYPFTQVVHIGGESAVSERQSIDRSRQISTAKIESELLYFRKHFGVSGVIAAVCLAALSNMMNACKGFLLRRDRAYAVAAIQETLIMIRLLIATGLASRATR